jgi:hypothetical protein
MIKDNDGRILIQIIFNLYIYNFRLVPNDKSSLSNITNLVLALDHFNQT